MNNLQLGRMYVTKRAEVVIPYTLMHHAIGDQGAIYEVIHLRRYKVEKNITVSSTDIKKEVTKVSDIFPLAHYNIINDVSIYFDVHSETFVLDDSIRIPIPVMSGYNVIVEKLKELEGKQSNTIIQGENIKIREVSSIILGGINPQDIESPIFTGDIHTRFEGIVNLISTSMEKINEMDILAHQKDIAEAFIKTKQQVSELASNNPSKIGFIKRLAQSYLPDKLINNIKEEYSKAQSTQENINKLFGEPIW